MSRLTNHFDYCEYSECGFYNKELAKENKCGFFNISRDTCHSRTIYNKLVEYEDFEEQELLIKLPCKVGSTVYVVETRCLAGEEPEEGCTFLDCEECIYDKTYIVFETKVDNMMMYHFMVGDNTNFIFNKTVFLTREEAEKALEEMERAEWKE